MVSTMDFPNFAKLSHSSWGTGRTAASAASAASAARPAPSGTADAAQASASGCEKHLSEEIFEHIDMYIYIDIDISRYI